MNAPRIVSLDHLTVFELPPPEVVRCAAAAGYRHVGLRLKPAAASFIGLILIQAPLLHLLDPE